MSMTDVWRAAGSPENKEPKNWLRSEVAVALSDVIAVQIKGDLKSLFRTKKGRTGGTEAHWQLFLAYAKYLSPEFHYATNIWVKERMEEDVNPELAISRGRERAVKAWRRMGFTDDQIAARLKGIDIRNIFTSILAKHAVAGRGFGDCTNAVYMHLFGGGAAVVRKKLALSENKNPRDFMSIEQLNAVSFAEGLASSKIDSDNLQGNEECSEACQIASRIAANAVTQMRKARLSQKAF